MRKLETNNVCHRMVGSSPPLSDKTGGQRQNQDHQVHQPNPTNQHHQAQPTGQATFKKCPSCNDHKTNDHVSACTHPDRVKLRKWMVLTIRKTMEKTNTNIQAQEIILQGLTGAILHGTDKNRSIHTVIHTTRTSTPSAPRPKRNRVDKLL